MNESDSPFSPYERIGTTGGVPGSVGSKKRGQRRLRTGVIALLVLALGLFWFGGDDDPAGVDDQVQAAASDRASDGDPASPGSMLLDAPKGRSTGEPSGTDLLAKPPAVLPEPIVKEPKRAPSSIESPIEGVISKWMRKARDLSKGKVTNKNTVVAVHVQRVGGEVLLDRNTKNSLRPASNLKLLTCMAAVVLCADSGYFETQFDRSGPVEAGVLKGDLIARAGGDPMFDEPSGGSVDRWTSSLAAQLKKAGIRKIQGSLVLDEGTYLEPGPGPKWPESKEYWKDYCALSGGFSANAGCLTALIKPGKVGGSGHVQVYPKGHGLKRTGRVKTVAKKKKLVIAVEAKGSNLMVRGSIPADVSRYNPSFSHPDPVELFGHAMLQGLKDNGVIVVGGLKRQRNVPEGQEVALLRTPLTETFQPILRDSNNSVADQLFLNLGHRLTGKGDRKSGAAAITAVMEVLGIDDTGMKIVDGSGLSKANSVRADQLAGVLSGLLYRGGVAADLFMEALPVSGKSGTLRKRMREGSAAGRVHAKTGFVNGTSALSGVVETLSGERLVFSILVSYPHRNGLNTNVFKPMQDEICALLAEYDGEAQ